MKRALTGLAIVCTAFFPAPCVQSQPASPNLLKNPDFEKGTEGWRALVADDPAAKYAITPGAGRDGAACVAYRKTAEGFANSHFDQDFDAEPDKTYAFGAWIRGDGTLKPHLRIADENWNTIALIGAPASREWVQIAGIFDSEEKSRFKFQWFGGSRGPEFRQGFSGESWLDNAFVRLATPEEIEQKYRATIRINAQRRVRKIGPLLFGSNQLFHIDDDASRADGKMARMLREAGCRLLRFPGGHVSDNYNWKTQTLDRPKQFPARWGPETTDTDEFMSFCREVGAEPIFCGNFAKAISGPGLEAAAANAADWVRYCNVEKGYGVKYWEIGNETYLSDEWTCTTAEKYAQGVVALSKAMKAVDPTIKIGANGPTNPTAAGRLDTVPWWPAVLERTIDHIDFIIIHCYFSVPSYSAYLHSRNDFAAGLRLTREYIREHYPARADMPIAITEWNTNKTSIGNSLGHAIVIATMLGEFAREGVEMGNYWPLRMKRGQWNRGLLQHGSNDPQPVYHAFRAFATMCRGSLVECTQEGVALAYAALSDDGRSLNVFVINPHPREIGCAISIDGFAPASPAKLHTLTGPSVEANNDEHSEAVSTRVSSIEVGPSFTLRAPGPSLCVVQLTGR